MSWRKLGIRLQTLLKEFNDSEPYEPYAVSGNVIGAGENDLHDCLCDEERWESKIFAGLLCGFSYSEHCDSMAKIYSSSLRNILAHHYEPTLYLLPRLPDEQKLSEFLGKYIFVKGTLDLFYIDYPSCPKNLNIKKHTLSNLLQLKKSRKIAQQKIYSKFSTGLEGELYNIILIQWSRETRKHVLKDYRRFKKFSGTSSDSKTPLEWLELTQRYNDSHNWDEEKKFKINPLFEKLIISHHFELDEEKVRTGFGRGGKRFRLKEACEFLSEHSERKVTEDDFFENYIKNHVLNAYVGKEKFDTKYQDFSGRVRPIVIIENEIAKNDSIKSYKYPFNGLIRLRKDSCFDFDKQSVKQIIDGGKLETRKVADNSYKLHIEISLGEFIFGHDGMLAIESEDKQEITMDDLIFLEEELNKIVGGDEEYPKKLPIDDQEKSSQEKHEHSTPGEEKKTRKSKKNLELVGLASSELANEREFTAFKNMLIRDYGCENGSNKKPSLPYDANNSCDCYDIYVNKEPSDKAKGLTWVMYYTIKNSKEKPTPKNIRLSSMSNIFQTAKNKNQNK